MNKIKLKFYAITVLLLTVLWVSCTTTASFTGSVPPARADTIGDMVPQWTAAGQTTAIAYFAAKIRTPRLELWALRVDLTNPAVQIVVTGQEPVDGALREGHVPSTTVSGFVTRYGLIAGINTNPFSPASGRTGEDRTIDGITIADGVLVSRPRAAFDALVFHDRDAVPENRNAVIVNQGELGNLESIGNAVGGFWIVLQNGELPERLGSELDAAGQGPRHPRSAAGLSADGRTLFLLAVDGRRPGSIGATEAELGMILRQLGASGGLGFDGGGSTALVLRRGDGAVRALNTPMHKHIPGWERGVASCLGIRIIEDTNDP